MAQTSYHPYPPMGDPDEATLLARLRAQVEFYFSPQNLARDTFLTSLLKQYGNAVPLETIAYFPKVRELHAIGRLGMVNVPPHAMPPADPFLLCRALEKSLVVTVSNMVSGFISIQTPMYTNNMNMVRQRLIKNLEKLRPSLFLRLPPLRPRLLPLPEYRRIPLNSRNK